MKHKLDIELFLEFSEDNYSESVFFNDIEVEDGYSLEDWNKLSKFEKVYYLTNQVKELLYVIPKEK